MNILITAHTCNPLRGSEEGMGWNWARSVAGHHRVWVLADPSNRSDVEARMAQDPCPNLRFVWPSVPRFLDPWRPGRGDRGVHAHYFFWQRAALRAARRLHAEHGFDVVHHVGWGSVSAPPPFWRIGVPFIWGPMGGGQTTPAAFRRYFGSAWRAEVFRSLRVAQIHRFPAVRAAVRNSALILSTNDETTRTLHRAGASEVRLFPDSGLMDHQFVREPRTHAHHTPLTLLWAGRLEPRKCLPLALEAVKRAMPHVPLRLLVAGDGPMRVAWERMASELELGDRVRFLGRVPWAGMSELFLAADAMLFTSLRDSFGSVVLESLGHALPLIALDHQGIASLVPAGAAAKVPVTDPEQTVQALAGAIVRLARRPDERTRIARAGWEFARKQSWRVRAARAAEWYEALRRGECASTGRAVLAATRETPVF